VIAAGAAIAAVAYAADGGFAAAPRNPRPTVTSAPAATVCRANAAGCTRGGTYREPDVLISANDGDFKVTWTSTVARSRSSGYPLDWTAGMTFTNATSATLQLGCPAATSIYEHMTGGRGDDGYVTAASISCDSDPSWRATVAPGDAINIDATFLNVPWPGCTVSILINGVDASPSIYPFN
jgi:hypothetical protein